MERLREKLEQIKGVLMKMSAAMNIHALFSHVFLLYLPGIGHFCRDSFAFGNKLT